MTPLREAAPFSVRPATSEDARQIAGLCGQLGYPSKTEDVLERLRGILPGEEHAVFVAEGADRHLAGWVHAFIYRSVEAGARAEIGGLVVDESCRSQGIGQKLLERAEEWARAKGCREVGLRSNVIRERAHAFYERLGYRHIKTQKTFLKPLEAEAPPRGREAPFQRR